MIFEIIEKKQEIKELTANSLHTGVIATSILRHHSFFEGKTQSLTPVNL